MFKPDSLLKLSFHLYLGHDLKEKKEKYTKKSWQKLETFSVVLYMYVYVCILSINTVPAYS